MKKEILWITRTAVFVALLVIVQAATAGLGNQYVTGSTVNLVLIVSAMTCGLGSGAAVAVLSPFFAKLFGIGPAFLPLLPFIALGNLSIVLVWHFIGGKLKINECARHIIACVLGAAVKFSVLYLGVVRICVPLILKLNEKQTAVVSASFSLPQLITALIGGAVAVILLPLLKKAIKQK